jgi:hypothetical protein
LILDEAALEEAVAEVLALALNDPLSLLFIFILIQTNRELSLATSCLSIF